MSLIKALLASMLAGFSFALMIDSFVAWTEDVPLPE